MDAPLLILVVFFVLLTVINLPVAVAMALATFLTILALADLPTCYIIAQRMSIGIASFPLLAIPHFILAGLLMGDGGVARRLIDFASSLIPGRRGGLAYVNTTACMLFGALSGSATAAVSSIGGVMIPEMTAVGYRRPYSVALTSAAATTGLLIPPSNIMIVYAVAAGNVSIAAMFAAGLLPGILVGTSILMVCFLLRHSRLANEPRTHDAGPVSRFEIRRVFQTGVRAVPGLLLIIIVLAGILRGWFSATEASAIAVLYAFVLTVICYRTVRLRDLPGLCLRGGMMTGVVFLLIGTSQAMSWILAYENVPQTISEALLATTTDGPLILLIMNVILLFVGAVMDMTPAVLIFTPILLPVAAGIGVDPVHFGMIMITNLCIGLCTPPVGTCLFVGCAVGKISIAQATRPMVPMVAAMIAALAAVTYFPPLTLWLPRALGL